VGGNREWLPEDELSEVNVGIEAGEAGELFDDGAEETLTEGVPRRSVRKTQN
jgi:hypothetical protein